MVCAGIGEKSKERRKGTPPVASTTDDMQSFIGRRTKDVGMWFGPGYSLASVFLLPFIITLSHQSAGRSRDPRVLYFGPNVHSRDYTG